MDKLKELKDKLTGASKYHNSLLGESLPDLLRKATAKTLITPDQEVNQQVVESINSEVSAGKDTKEIVNLLKKRLRTDNPQKQWLGVLLFQKVMAENQAVLGMHQEELLQEVARVMARPAKPETDAGKQARHAAKEVLRQYGRAGTSAFRAAHQAAYGRHAQQRDVYQGDVAATGFPYPEGYPAYQMPGAAGGGGGALSVEKQSLAEEMNLLIEKARSNTELLSDMLVNSSGPAGDEFEKELVRDLLTEVHELRGLFTAYLEQLQGMDGPEMEVLMVQALEAADMLDGCIQLQKEVSSNQELPHSPTGGNGTAAAAAAPKETADLIALDDPMDSAPAPTAAAAPAAAYDPFAASVGHDPFAASTAAPLYPGAPAAAPAGQPAQPGQPGQPGLKSAFESMFAQPGGGQAFDTLAASAAPVPGPPAPTYSAPAGVPPQPTNPYGAPQVGGYPSSPPQYPTAGNPYAPVQQPTQQYSTPAQPYSTPVQQYGAAPQYNPYAPVAAAPQPVFAGTTSSNNPFAAPLPVASGSIQSVASNSFLPMPPMGISAGGGNPFAAAAPAPTPAAPVAHASSGGANSAAVEQEWTMFFADRAAAAAPSNTAQAQVNADFDALVGAKK